MNIAEMEAAHARLDAFAKGVAQERRRVQAILEREIDGVAASAVRVDAWAPLKRLWTLIESGEGA